MRGKTGFGNGKIVAALMIRRFMRQDCFSAAAALSYTSLLALVPLLTVAFSIYAAFPAFHDLQADIQDLLFANLAPHTTDAVTGQLQGFVENAASLSLPGVTFLFVTAFMLLATIENAFNHIWRVRCRRSLLVRFLGYWAILTMGPLLLAVAVAASKSLTDTTLVDAPPTLAGLAIPLLAAWLGFALLYGIMPHARVAVRYALAGGLFAALCFEALKHGFKWYLTAFPTYNMIYGALAAVPVFLVWMYAVWLVALAGGVLTATLQQYCRHVFMLQESGENDPSLR